jgi:hypothetical protein
MNYHRGEEWYRNHFSEFDGEQIVGEETPSYIRDERTPERIAETIPDVKLIFTLRNPIDRAYSHWWHEKSKDKHSFKFSEVLGNYDLYQNWIVPGLYHRHLTQFAEYIPEENMKICFFDDLVDDDLAYVQDVYRFLGIDDGFVPSLINEKVNQGKFRKVNRQAIYTSLASRVKKIAPQSAIDKARPAHRQILSYMASQTEYEEGMNEQVRHQLEAQFIDDTRRLSEYTGRNLEHWFDHSSL